MEELNSMVPKIEELEKKIDKLQRSIDRITKAFVWGLIISAVLILLPLIGLFFVIPQFLSNYSDVMSIFK